DGMRRSWLKGFAKVTKRYLIAVAAHNLGRILRKIGKPRALQGEGGLGTLVQLVTFARMWFPKQRQQFARPTAAEEAEVLWGEGEPPADDHDQPISDRDVLMFGLEHASQTSALKVPFHRGDQRRAGQCLPSDLSIRAPLGQQKNHQR